MTECARCGDCCTRVVPSQAVADLRRKLANPYYAGWNRNQAEKIVQALTERIGTSRGQPVYSCRHFDPDTRLCTAHTERPWMCAGFPWYQDDDWERAYGHQVWRVTSKPPRRPELGDRIPRDMSPRCSFISDVRKMLPLVSV